MSKALDIAATKAVIGAGFETKPHFCNRWARQVVEQVYGRKFDALIHKPSAREAGLAFKADGRFVVPLEHGSLPGDLLYKLTGSGGDGHVGIRVTGNRVAENSSVHWGDGDTDARGFRSLIEFGHYDLIVRLPEPQP